MPRLLGDVNNVITIDITTVFDVFSFFLFLDGSLRALMIRAETEGTASIWACPNNQALQSPASLAMSLPTVLKTDPGG